MYHFWYTLCIQQSGIMINIQYKSCDSNCTYNISQAATKLIVYTLSHRESVSDRSHWESVSDRSHWESVSDCSLILGECQWPLPRINATKRFLYAFKIPGFLFECVRKHRNYMRDNKHLILNHALTSRSFSRWDKVS